MWLPGYYLNFFCAYSERPVFGVVTLASFKCELRSLLIAYLFIPSVIQFEYQRAQSWQFMSRVSPLMIMRNYPMFYNNNSHFVECQAAETSNISRPKPFNIRRQGIRVVNSLLSCVETLVNLCNMTTVLIWRLMSNYELHKPKENVRKWFIVKLRWTLLVSLTLANSTLAVQNFYAS